MSKVAAVGSGNSSANRSDDTAGEPTSKRKSSGRVQKDRGTRKDSPENTRAARGQSKRRKKRPSGRKEEPGNDNQIEEGENDDPMVIYENENNEDDEQTDSGDSTTDSDTDSDSDEEEPTTAPNTTTEDVDEEEDDEDEVMDDDFYARRRRSLLGYNASFNYTRLALEKLTDHPIVLRACDSETMWDNKELASLQEDLRLLYKKARQRIKTMKRDVRKLDVELQRKRDMTVKRPKTPNETNTANDDKNKDIKQRVCGVMNSRGNPCQRTGFCPFHHKLTNTRGLPRPYDFFKRREETNFEHPVETNSAMVASGPKEKQEKLQVSVLLVAAAALERKGIDDTDMQNDTLQQQEQQRQIQEQQFPKHHEPTPSHGFHQIPNAPFFGKPFNAMPQLPSLHDLSERPPPAYSFETQPLQDAFMHNSGIPRNTTAL